jgi:hypothetical protein
MPEISLLQPTVLNGYIRKKPFPQQFLGLGLMGTPRPYAFPVFKYDVLVGRTEMSKPNAPNAEAHIRPHGGIGQVAGSFIYMRDKKTFEPTTLHWLREPGELAKANAEAAVTREVNELDDAIMRFGEWAVWEMLITGKLVVNRADAPRVDIDYKVPASHIVTAVAPWSTASTDIMGDVRTWTTKVVEDSGFSVTDAAVNSTTFNYLLKNTDIKNLFNEQRKEEFLKTRSVKGLLGLDWLIYDLTYVDDWTTPGTSTTKKFVPDEKVVFLARAPDAYGIWEGPSADDEAPKGNTGKFSKSWKEKDPSSRLVLEEYSFVPTLPRPDNILIADVVP